MVKRKSHWSDFLEGLACASELRKLRKYHTVRAAWKVADRGWLDWAYCLIHGFVPGASCGKEQRKADRRALHFKDNDCSKYGTPDRIRALIPCPTLAQLRRGARQARKQRIEQNDTE